MGSPLITVALATYRGERFLAEQLDSIFAQDHPAFEVLVADDASDDGTLAILERYPVEVERRPHNLGFVANFEGLLRRAKGDYVALADQDDVWKPHKLSTLLAGLEGSGADLAYSDAEIIDEAGAKLADSYWATHGIRPVAGRARHALYFRNAVTGCTVLLARRLLEDALPIPAGFPYHDWWLAYVAAQGRGLWFTEERLVRYRDHGANVIGPGVRRREKAPFLARKWAQQAKMRRAGDTTLRAMQAFLAYERAHGHDSARAEVLVRWAEVNKRGLHLARFAPFLAAHPEMFAIEADPEAWRRKARRTVPVLRAIAAAEAAAPILAGLAALGWLLR